MINIFNIRPQGFNVGNDVIHMALNHFLRMAIDQNYNVISLPATGKYESHRKARLSSQTVYEINQFGSGVIIGGGNLYENDELEVNPIALRALEKPLMIFSVSRGRIFNREFNLVPRTDTMADNKIKLLHEHADLSLSRDEATTEYIKGLGCDTEFGGCPTLFIDEIPQHQVPIVNDESSDCLISIRTPSLMSIPVEYQYKLKTQINQLVELLKAKGYPDIKILCHDHRDLSFAASFSNLDYLYTEDIYTYLTYLRKTRLNLSFRLHSFLPCLAYDLPTIKISYDERAISMLDSIGMGEWNINLLKDDLLAEVSHRLDHLDDLESIKNDLKKDRWPGIRQTMLDACNSFAESLAP